MGAADQPSWEKGVAEALGLERLSSLQHAAGRVAYVWSATILDSSYDLPAVVAVARIDGGPPADRLRAAFGVTSFSEAVAVGVAALVDDPIAKALRCINLLAPPEGACLDGISYDLHTNAALRGRLHFSNPLSPGLRRVEASLYKVAEHVAVASGKPLLLQYLSTWKGYIV